MTDYRPIACDQHSVLEVLALRRSRVEVRAVDEHGELATLSGEVTDILTRDRAEFLVVDVAGQTHPLRLDRLREIRAPDGEVLWRQISDKLV